MVSRLISCVVGSLMVGLLLPACRSTAPQSHKPPAEPAASAAAPTPPPSVGTCDAIDSCSSWCGEESDGCGALLDCGPCEECSALSPEARINDLGKGTLGRVRGTVFSTETGKPIPAAVALRCEASELVWHFDQAPEGLFSYEERTAHGCALTVGARGHAPTTVALDVLNCSQTLTVELHPGPAACIAVPGDWTPSAPVVLRAGSDRRGRPVGESAKISTISNPDGSFVLPVPNVLAAQFDAWRVKRGDRTITRTAEALRRCGSP